MENRRSYDLEFVTYEDVFELVMALGGEQATLLQTRFAKTLQRQSAASNVRFSIKKATCFFDPTRVEVTPPGS